MEKLISSSILEWMKGLYIMRSKAARFSPTDHQLASALLAPQLRALYLDVLTSGEATFGATISDVTDEKCESTREEYRQRISRNPKVADQVAKQMTGDVSNLLMDDELKLVAWMVQYLNIATVLRNMATPPDPAGKLERSALLRAFVEELRETASSILEAEDIEAFEVPQSALSAAREAAQKYHDKFVLRVREQRAQEQQKKQEALREQRRQQKEAAAPSAPRAANLPRQGNVGTSSVREEDAEDGTPMSPLRPPSSPLNLEPEEVRKIRAPAERRSIADAQVKGTFRKGWKVEGLAVPKNFTRADMAHYEEYLSLTYQELRRLMFEIACAIMGRVNFTNMKPPLPTDLQFYLTAYYVSSR
ncbi:hypothetical protein R1sor_025558 [Riccia sorocarpa]|uniref:Uncharacterized protein n=1 Tax=Riccia sorocarpa TaxID=122646 RepID=A0ABD3GC73_9MARC